MIRMCWRRLRTTTSKPIQPADTAAAAIAVHPRMLSHKGAISLAACSARASRRLCRRYQLVGEDIDAEERRGKLQAELVVGGEGRWSEVGDLRGVSVCPHHDLERQIKRRQWGARHDRGSR